MNALTTERGAVPQADTLGDVLRLADLLAKSSMVPQDYQGRPENVALAILWGREVGLNPLQALTNISVINGRASIWGDAALALVQAHPACEGVSEGIEGAGDARHGWCEVRRKGRAPVRRTFSVADAKLAGLWGKRGRNGNPTPWITYPDRMLQMRARGFALRDAFPDALRGVITVEEAQDIPTEPRFVENTAPAAAAQDRPVIDPAALVSASSLGLPALDEQLANLASPDDLRGYLADPRTRDWIARLRRNRPEQAAQADAIIAAAWARVDPSTRDDGDVGEEPADWRRMAWPIRSRDGTCSDLGGPDEWEREYERRVTMVQNRRDLSPDVRRRLLGAVLEANRELLAELRERGHGAAVEAVEALFAEALAADATLPAAAE